MVSASGGVSSCSVKDASSFSISDFCAAVRSRRPSSRLASLDLLQNVAQLAGRAFRGRSRDYSVRAPVLQKVSQGSQTVSLLLDARGFADPVGHQAHQTLGQFRHFLDEFGKQRGRKSQDAAVGHRPPAHGKLLHPRKRQHSGNVARLQVERRRFRRRFRRAPASWPSRTTNMASAGVALAEIASRPPSDASPATG